MKSKPSSPLFLALALGFALASASAQERPNVLFISVDDLNDMPTFMGRYKTIPPSGPTSPSSPNTTRSRTNSNPGSLKNTSRSHSASNRKSVLGNPDDDISRPHSPL
jgi:hypothetical protein